MDASYSGRQAFERQIEQRRLKEMDGEILQAFRRGWCLGGEEFRREMLKQIEGKLGEHHAGELRRETSAAADRIIAGA